jgi:hypothetical protein
MTKTTKKQGSLIKSPRVGAAYHLRVPGELDAEIKEWIAKQPREPKPLTIPQAILRLTLKGLASEE